VTTKPIRIYPVRISSLRVHNTDSTWPNSG
jgi:hypothetical protein